MQRHPNAQRLSGLPLFPMKCVLQCTGGGDCIARARENDEKTVALTALFDEFAACCHDAVFPEPIMPIYCVTHSLGLTFGMSRAIFDIGEKKGYGPVRPLAHGSLLYSKSTTDTFPVVRDAKSGILPAFLFAGRYCLQQHTMISL